MKKPAKGNTPLNAFHWKQQPGAIDFKKKEKRTRVAPTNGRAVEQLSMEGEVINRFDSMASAADSIGMQSSHIYRVCNGLRKSSGGYRWRYADTRSEKILRDRFGGTFSKAIQGTKERVEKNVAETLMRAGETESDAYVMARASMLASAQREPRNV